MTVVRNIYSPIATEKDREAFEILLQTDSFRLERILSECHATPAGECYDQPEDEWVILLRGSAGLTMEGEPAEIVLNPGNHILIPAHQKHRVEWTSATEKTCWLALHFKNS
ncbi:MAG: cupin domain-containing protein [Methylococcaceae bacterium]|nr:cupin domain-containing protein [Methylococcaceae bacterium]